MKRIILDKLMFWKNYTETPRKPPLSIRIVNWDNYEGKITEALGFRPKSKIGSESREIKSYSDEYTWNIINKIISKEYCSGRKLKVSLNYDQDNKLVICVYN
jgi:hypothetical protein